MSYNVRVSVRIRPSSHEHVITHTDTEVHVPPNRVFTYDLCFGPSTAQTTIYEKFGHDILSHALEGFNASIIAYGQTGSGKTHTMQGSNRSPGLIPQLCTKLFNYVDEVQHTTAVTVRLSYLEVYNEHVRDLLTSSSSEAAGGSSGSGSSSSSSGSGSSSSGSGISSNNTTPVSLKVRSTSQNDCTVEGLSEYKVSSVGEVLDFLERGARLRATASTKMNDQSSRSHAVVTLSIRQQLVSRDGKDTREKHSAIKLVDLAGSERAGSSGATGERLKEGNNINKSLVTLGRVISALAEQAAAKKATTVVPYRDSVLTRLLQNALGGNSRTAMIACVAPDAENQDQTLSTLRYADYARRITNRAHVNDGVVTRETQGARFANMQRELNELRQQLAVKSNAPSDAGLMKLVQFYEDEAAREKVRTKMLEMQKEEAEREADQVKDFLREVLGKGMSSIDAREINLDDLCEVQDGLIRELGGERKRIQELLARAQ